MKFTIEEIQMASKNRKIHLIPIARKEIKIFKHEVSFSLIVIIITAKIF
jgi:hypothetical protein